MRKTALLLVALSSGALAQAPGLPPSAQQLGQTLPQRAPARTYAGTCGYCHGTNVGPILLGRHLPVAYIKAMARAGRNGMPAFRPSEVTPAELDALAQWISTAPRHPEEHGQ